MGIRRPANGKLAFKRALRLEVKHGIVWLMRRYKWLLVLVVCLLAMISLWLAFRPPADPIYRGRTLTSWADQYSNAHQGRQRAYLPSSSLRYEGVDAEAEEAMRAIGTNAFPVVLKWLHFEDDHSSVRLYYSLGLDHLPSALRNRIRQWVFDDRGLRRAQEASQVLQVLGPDAVQIAPRLIRLCNKASEPDTAYRSLAVLGTLGTNALPQLMQVLQNTNHPYRGAAVRQVEQILSRSPPLSLQTPLLVECLHDRNSSLVILACQLLCATSPNRTLAIPALQSNLLSLDPTVRAASSNTLHAISPENSTNLSSGPRLQPKNF